MGQIKKAVLQAKEVHDKYYNSLDWLNKKITGVIRTNEVPYYQRFVPSIGNMKYLLYFLSPCLTEKKDSAVAPKL